MLTDTLKKNKYFQSLPVHEQEIIARLSSIFQTDTDHLYRSAEELAIYTDTGSPDHWSQFLSMEPVQAYIKNKMTQITQIAQRKAFLSLQREAQGGNVGAVKEINELSGIMQRSDQNKVVVLHKISRPTYKEETYEQTHQSND